MLQSSQKTRLITAHDNHHQPYPRDHQVLDHINKKHTKWEKFQDLCVQDMVWAGKVVGRNLLPKVETTPFQEAFLSCGLHDIHDLADNIVFPVDMLMGYLAILGVELFAELQKTNKVVEEVDKWTTFVENKVILH